MASANNAFNLKGPKTGILVQQGGARNSGIMSQPNNLTNIDISKNPLFAPQQPKITSSISQGTNKGLVSKSSADPATLTLQKQLNSKNKGQSGWVPLAEDGIFGPKTKAAVEFKPQQQVMSNQQIQAPVAPQQMNTQQPQAPKAPTAPSAQPLSYQGLLGQFSQMATTGSQQVQDANAALEQFRTNQANTVAGIESQAIPVEFQQGRAQAVQRAAATREAALQQGVANALTSQQQQYSALGTLGGLLQPQVTQYGQTVFNPLSGQFGQGGGDSTFNAALQQYAQLRASGQEALIPSSVSGNPVLNAQVTAMAQQSNPNYNYNAALGGANALQQNTQTAGTVQTQTAATGYQGAVQKYQEMTTQNSAADAQAQNVQNILSSTGINSNSTDFNKALNNLKGRLGSTAVTKLVSSITELQAIYTTLLSAGGGTPTGNEQQALTVLNPNSSPAQIIASLEQLQLAAFNKLNAQYQQAQTYYSNLQGGGGQSGYTPSGSGNIYDF